MEPVTSQTRLYFDQEISLTELLKAVNHERLQKILVSLLGTSWRLLNARGEEILGTAAMPLAGAERVPFRLELEPIGYLESPNVERLAAAAMMMELLVQSAARYFMAAAMQMESVKLDFEELQAKNAELRVSEQRYRDLAASLEQRVAEQVKTIEATQLQLYQAEKLASVGQLAAGVAHEINNPLGFIRSNLSTAAGYVGQLSKFATLMRAGLDGKLLATAWQREQLDAVLEDFPVLLQESIDGVARVAKIVAALKDFSSIDRVEETSVDINALIQTACQVAASELGERIRLTLELGALPPPRAHAGRLSQVFMNLLLNAVQAICGEGEIRIVTHSDGRNITVAIHDTGKGISTEALTRIFDPFYTTREVGQGTGLGLTVARDVVRAHGGSIQVTSQPGLGTTFTITLPVDAHD